MATATTAFHSSGSVLGDQSHGPVFTLGRAEGPSFQKSRSARHSKHSPQSKGAMSRSASVVSTAVAGSEGAAGPQSNWAQPTPSHPQAQQAQAAAAAPTSDTGSKKLGGVEAGAAAGSAAAGAPCALPTPSAFIPPAVDAQSSQQPAPTYNNTQPAFPMVTSISSPLNARKPSRSHTAKHRSHTTPTAPLESLFAAAVATPLPQSVPKDQQQPAAAAPPAPAPNAMPLPSASCAAAAARAGNLQQTATGSVAGGAPAADKPARFTFGDDSSAPKTSGEQLLGTQDFQSLSERFNRLMQSTQEAVPATTSSASGPGSAEVAGCTAPGGPTTSSASTEPAAAPTQPPLPTSAAIAPSCAPVVSAGTAPAPVFTAGESLHTALSAPVPNAVAASLSPAPSAPMFSAKATPPAADGPSFTFGTMSGGSGTPGSTGKSSARKRGVRGLKGAPSSSSPMTATPLPSFNVTSNAPGSSSTSTSNHPGYSPMAWSPQYEPAVNSDRPSFSDRPSTRGTLNDSTQLPCLFGNGSLGNAFSSPDVNEGYKEEAGAGLDTSALPSFGFSGSSWSSSGVQGFGSDAFCVLPSNLKTDVPSAGSRHLDQARRHQEHLQKQQHGQQQQEEQQQRDTSQTKDAGKAGAAMAGAQQQSKQEGKQQQTQGPMFGNQSPRAGSLPVHTTHFPFQFSSPGPARARSSALKEPANLPSFAFGSVPPPAPPAQPAAAQGPPSADPAGATESINEHGAAVVAAAAAAHHRRHVRARSYGRVPQQAGGSTPSDHAAFLAQQQQQAVAHAQWKADTCAAAQAAQAAQPSSRQLQASSAKLKGNADYAAQNYQSAEAAYSTALGLLTADGIGGTEAAVLHSNRAGARLMVGKPAAALADALMAVQLDPKFFKAVSRAATCHCRMGDFASAKRILDKVLDKLSASSSHFQDIYKKLQEVEALSRSMEVVSTATLKNKADKDSLIAALSMLDSVHPQVVYSEPMAALRVRTLLACNRTSDALSAMEVHYEAPHCIRQAPWRSWLSLQARYHMGDLAGASLACEQLMAKLDKRRTSGSVTAGAGADKEAAPFGGNSEVALEFAAVRLPTQEELKHLLEHMKSLQFAKTEGNAAIKCGNHQLAVDKYTAALALNAPLVFAAVLYSNRAAAFQGLGQITDAMADCARARALDPTYVRAATRLATLLQEVRRSEQAADILAAIPTGAGSDLSQSERQAIANQITAARATAAWQKTHDHYRVMGLERTCTEEEVRKTYRKAALKYHPDKAATACKFCLSPPLSADGSHEAEGELAPVVQIAGQGAGVEARVTAEANWLFNLIGQAHEELSDKAKRRRHDMLLDAEQAPAFKSRFPSANTYARYDPFANFPGSYSFRKQGSARTSAGPSASTSNARTGASNYAGFGSRSCNTRNSSSGSSTGAAPQYRASHSGTRPSAAPKTWYRRAAQAVSGSDDDEEDDY